MMYLLLRDNKQSGPYSLDDLKIMGLKAYDLVWVDGKSAAWRYPCEIDELSAFAPAVEEQPFDRFFKKTSSVKANNNSSIVSSAPGPVSEPSTVPGKRIIYVTMPAGNGLDSPVPALNNRFSRPEPIGVTPDPGEKAPLVEFMPRPERRRSNPILKPLIIGLALLAAGIFIGLSINKDTISLQPKIKLNSQSPDNGQVNHTIEQQLPVPNSGNDHVPEENKEQQPDTVATIVSQTALSKSIGETTTSVTVASPGTADRPGKTTAQKARSAGRNARNQVPSASQAKDSASGALSVIHREDVQRADVEEKPAAGAEKEASAKANIASQVSVGANGYTVGTFGGINDLQVTVSNRSVYPLDLVVVEVQYIQANKKIYKKENLYFRGIGAGSALMLEAPKSSRGIKVLYKITMINSKELGLSYSGI